MDAVRDIEGSDPVDDWPDPDPVVDTDDVETRLFGMSDLDTKMAEDRGWLAWLEQNPDDGTTRFHKLLGCGISDLSYIR